MKRGVLSAPCVVVLAGLLAGCQTTPTAPAAKQSTSPSAAAAKPKVGQCWDVDGTDLRKPDHASLKAAASCDGDHLTETVLVADFPGDPAATGGVPALDELPVATAVQDACDKAATDYLGGEWRGSLTEVIVVLPGRTDWAAGDHTYRCDLRYFNFRAGGIGDVVDYLRRKGSVRGDLAGARTLAVTCADVNGNVIVQRGCQEPHNGEFAGVALVPKAGLSWQDKQVGAACDVVIAKYLGMTPAQYGKRTDLTTYWADALDPYVQALNNRQPRARCFAVIEDKHRIHSSIAGIGTKKLPA